MATQKETNVAELETDETYIVKDEVSETSEDEQETSSESAEAEEVTGEAPESEKPEETIEEKVDRLAQSKSDKSLKTYQKKIQDLSDKNNTLTSQLNERLWDISNEDLFNEESGSMDENKVKQRQEARAKVKEQVLEYQKNKTYVEKTKPELEQKESFLNIAERTQLVREKIWPLFFPEDSKNLKAYQEALKLFEKASDPDDVEIIFESLRQSKGSGKTSKTDSGQKAGGGRVDLSKLSTADRVARALEKMDKGK